MAIAAVCSVSLVSSERQTTQAGARVHRDACGRRGPRRSAGARLWPPAAAVRAHASSTASGDDLPVSGAALAPAAALPPRPDDTTTRSGGACAPPAAAAPACPNLGGLCRAPPALAGESSTSRALLATRPLDIVDCGDRAHGPPAPGSAAPALPPLPRQAQHHVHTDPEATSSPAGPALGAGRDCLGLPLLPPLVPGLGPSPCAPRVGRIPLVRGSAAAGPADESGQPALALTVADVPLALGILSTAAASAAGCGAAEPAGLSTVGEPESDPADPLAGESLEPAPRGSDRGDAVTATAAPLPTNPAGPSPAPRSAPPAVAEAACRGGPPLCGAPGPRPASVVRPAGGKNAVSSGEAEPAPGES